jgi:hypothetical protein
MRDAFRSFDPFGRGMVVKMYSSPLFSSHPEYFLRTGCIPIEEFLDAVSLRYNMQFSVMNLPFCLDLS